MKIRRMQATFGKLQNETLELGEGLNIIEAANEAGKSTWSAFIRAMLYGIPTKERDKQGFIAEKNRYQPWSGSNMEGRMDVVWEGREITLLRSQNRTVPFGHFEAVDTHTGEPIPELTGENVGEMLIGAPREVFERSAFLGQGAAAVDGTPALEKRVSALVSSGEEDVSYSQVERRMKDWLNRRKHNRTGLIPKLEKEVQDLDDDLGRQAHASTSARESAEALEELKEEEALLRRELAAHQYQAEQERRTVWDQAQQELKEARSEEESLLSELNRHGQTPDWETLREGQQELTALRAMDREVRELEKQREQAQQECREAERDLQDPSFPKTGPEGAMAWAEDLIRAQEELKKEQEKKPVGALALAGVLIAAGLAAAGVGLALPEYRIPALIGGGALVAAGAVLAVVKLRARAESLRRESARLGADDPEEIRRRAERYIRCCERQKRAAEHLSRMEAEKAELVTQREQRKGTLFGQVRVFAPDIRDEITAGAAITKALGIRERLEKAVIRREGAERLAQRLPQPREVAAETITPRYDSAYTMARLSAVEDESQRLERVLAMAQGELKTLGDPDAAQSRREAACQELADRKLEYEALELALSGLEQAGRDLQAQFAPGLNKRAGALFAKLTGGAYDSVVLTREFDALAQEKGSVLPRRVLMLSQGTADQLYLAVRLAVCELALPEDFPPPVVLDDALTNFDDERMERALRVLQELAENRQILLFTCHHREGALLAGDRSVNQITLDSHR